MSSIFQTSMTDLTGINTASNNSIEWDFHGKIISTKQYANDFDEDLAAVLAEGRSADLDPEAVKSDHYNKPANVSPRSSSFSPCLSGTTYVASSYADTEASMRPNYAAPSYDSMSQYSTFVPTPTASVVQAEDDYSYFTQNESVEPQQYTYSDFPIYTSGHTPFDSWYDKPERHEHIAYKLSDPAADPMVQKKEKKEEKKSNSKKVQKRK